MDKEAVLTHVQEWIDNYRAVKSSEYLSQEAALKTAFSDLLRTNLLVEKKAVGLLSPGMGQSTPPETGQLEYPDTTSRPVTSG